MSQRVYGALPLVDETPLRKYPLSATFPQPVATVERTLEHTTRVKRYYAQRGPLCVAYSIDMLLTFHNGSLYHPGWLYYRAGGDGIKGVHTDAALKVAQQGNVAVGPEFEPPRDSEGAPENDVSSVPANPDHAIKEWRWLSRNGRAAVDEARSSIAAGLPFVFVYGWGQTNMVWKTDAAGRVWIDVTPPLGLPQFNWHQICITGALDSIDAFYTPNSFGGDGGSSFHYSYEDFATLIDSYGSYGATVTDKVTGTEVPQPIDPPITFACRFCNKTFPTKEKRRRHIRRRHR